MGGLGTWIGQREVIPEIDQDRAITEGFNASLWIYAIIKKNADKFADIPRYLYDEGKLNEEKGKHFKLRTKAFDQNKLFDSDLNKLLERPNEYYGQSLFFAQLYAFYLSCGETFIWLNRGDVTQKLDKLTGQLVNRSDKDIDAMPVLEMYVLPANHMKVYTDPENVFGVTGYCLEVAGAKIEFRKNDIIHWKDLNLRFDATTGIHLRGMTRMLPGSGATQENKEITKSSVRMYKNDGARGLLYAPELSDVTPEQESDIRTVANAKLNENDVKGAIALLFGAKWEYIDMAVSAVDTKLFEGKVNNTEELCALFDTPRLLFVPTAATLANLENTTKNWINGSIIPAVKRLDDELNRRLLPAFGAVGKAKIISDWSELPELQQDMNQLVTTLASAWWVSPNQKLIAMGYEAVEDESFNEPWIPTGIQPLSQSQGDGYDQQLQELEKRGIKR